MIFGINFRVWLFSCCLVILVQFPLRSRSQSWVADTLVFPFGIQNIENAQFSMEPGKDQRQVFSSFLSVFEKKKALFFPVDQIVRLNLPLTTSLSSKFVSQKNISYSYFPVITEFEVHQQKAGGKRRFELCSTIELWQPGQQADTLLVGTLYHEQTWLQKSKQPPEEGYLKVIDLWSNRFYSDVLAIQHQVDQFLPNELPGYRKGRSAIRKNLYLSSDWFLGTKFWGIDGEIWFSRPEIGKQFRRHSAILRYQEHADFRSVALGKQVGLFNLRLNDNWIFCNKTAFLLGFNNWKDMKTVGHKFEEVLLFNLSATQKICYNRFDKTGILFGAGLIENLHYIIHHKPALKVGAVFTVGLKL